MDMDQVFPSKYLKAEDLGKRSHEVTIASVQLEEMKDNDGGRSMKPMITFEGVEKGIILNKTNTETIKSLYGSESDDWIGQKIVIFPSIVVMDGVNKPCIRIQPPVAASGGGISLGGGRQQTRPAGNAQPLQRGSTIGQPQRQNGLNGPVQQDDRRTVLDNDFNDEIPF